MKAMPPVVVEHLQFSPTGGRFVLMLWAITLILILAGKFQGTFRGTHRVKYSESLPWLCALFGLQAA